MEIIICSTGTNAHNDLLVRQLNTLHAILTSSDPHDIAMHTYLNCTILYFILKCIGYLKAFMSE